jgi:hypothetical protein
MNPRRVDTTAANRNGGAEMRRVSAIVLIIVGIAAVVVAVLVPTVGVHRYKKAPLDVNVTEISAGSARILDAQSGQTRVVPVRSTRVVKTDKSASNATNTTVDATRAVVIVQGSTPNFPAKSDPRVLSLSTDRVTQNRRSGQSVHVPAWREAVNGITSARHVGLSYRWPIDAKKKTYLFFQPDIAQAFPAIYEGTARVEGLTVYRYRSDTGVRTALLNGQRFLVNGKLPGSYQDVRTVWVEPRTGVIVKGTEHQVLRIDSPVNPNGIVAFDARLTFGRAVITSQANYAKDKLSQLRWLQLWIPIGTGVIALAAFAGAFLLLRSGRAAGRAGGVSSVGPPSRRPSHPEPPVSAGSTS